MYQGIHGEVRRQFVGVGFLLPPCGFQLLDVGGQVLQYVPLPVECSGHPAGYRLDDW